MAYKITHPNYLKAKNIIKEFEYHRDLIRNKRSKKKSIFEYKNNFDVLWFFRQKLSDMINEISKGIRHNPEMKDIILESYNPEIIKLRNSIKDRQIMLFKNSLNNQPAI